MSKKQKSKNTNLTKWVAAGAKDFDAIAKKYNEKHPFIFDVDILRTIYRLDSHVGVKL